MKIERFVFGMFNGKIGLAKTDGVCDLITDVNFQYLRNLTETPETGYLWLPTEQVIAFPRITTVYDDDGRDFVQNQTLLVPIHDYIKLTRPKGIFDLPFFAEDYNFLPEILEPLEVNE